MIMNDFDLLQDLPREYIEVDSKALENFIENVDNVTKLWRLTDSKEPNFFSLRMLERSKKLETYVSLMELLQEFIQANSNINEFDLFFAYMVRNVRKLDKIVDKDKLNELSSLYLDIKLIISRARSTPIFLEKIDKIKIDISQRRKPFLQHWQLYYADPSYCEDKDIIDLLMSCSLQNPIYIKSESDEYLDYIYNLNLNSPNH